MTMTMTMKMNMKRMATAAGLLLAAMMISGTVLSDDDDRESGGNAFSRWLDESRLDVAPVTDPRYRDECGSCHFAYQPGLLPARSWDRVMASLQEHFGDNAEVGEPLLGELRAYLRANAADASEYKRSRGFSRSIGPGEAPLRITDTRYFTPQHDEVASRFVAGNPQVRSFSNCVACHPRAGEGSYNEHEIRIPGFGPWDD